MNPLKKQRKNNATFQNRIVIEQLRFLNREIRYLIPDFDPPPQNSIYSATPDYLVERHSLHKLYGNVRREEFDVKSHKQLHLIFGYTRVLWNMAEWDGYLLRNDSCPDKVTELWTSWENIEEKLGFELPFADISERRDCREYSAGLLPRIWEAICKLAPVEVRSEGEGGTQLGLKFRK